MDCGIWTDGCSTSVYGYLSDDCEFLIVKGVMDGDEKKYVAKVLMYFSEQELKILQSRGYTDV